MRHKGKDNPTEYTVTRIERRAHQRLRLLATNHGLSLGRAIDSLIAAWESMTPAQREHAITEPPTRTKARKPRARKGADSK